MQFWREGFAALRGASIVKLLAPPQHLQDRLHPLLACLRLFRRLQSKRDRIDIGSVERGEERPRLCVPGKRREKILRHFRFAGRVIGDLQAAIRLRRCKRLASGSFHPAGPGQPRDVLEVFLRPDASGTARRELAQP